MNLMMFMQTLIILSFLLEIQNAGTAVQATITGVQTVEHAAEPYTIPAAVATPALNSYQIIQF